MNIIAWSIVNELDKATVAREARREARRDAAIARAEIRSRHREAARFGVTEIDWTQNQ